jgi:alpha-1,3-rhamnosyltransferase
LLQPLVSIIVTTYNAAKFVIETLESAKAQTYQPIELIISDDCSTDNTIELCTKWVQENKHHFTHTAIITVPVNTGVSANCNRCIQAANANWIKFIAGDDILLPNCIVDNMQFVQANKDAAIIFSKVMLYNNNFEQQNFLATYPDPYPMNIMDPQFTAANQFTQLLLSDRINFTPSYFFKKQTLVSVGGYDEGEKFAEDYPMWLKLTKANIKLSYFDIPTVGYRRHQAAANNMDSAAMFKPLYLKSGTFLQKNVYPFLPWDIAGSKRFVLMMAKLFNAIGLNKKTNINTTLFTIATVFFNPFHYIVYFKKKVLKLGNHNLFYSDKKNHLGA